MEDLVLSAIGDTLKALNKTTTWSFVFLLATAASALQRGQKIKFGDFEIDTNYAGTLTFALLCGINFEILRLLQNLSFLFSRTGTKIDQAIMFIRTYPWMLNPFTETSGGYGLFTDNFGFALLLMLWWFGFHTGMFLNQDSKSISIGLILSMVYLAFGILSMLKIFSLLSLVNDDTLLIKQGILIVAIPLGAYGLRKIFYSISED